ncbi:MAG: hypothetical protein C5B59_04640 [Bacteroidetes bacterium]|nr:MAG: hypothetical protein C5B59_04640 [Bacteroidota bacterium]
MKKATFTSTILCSIFLLGPVSGFTQAKASKLDLIDSKNLVAISKMGIPSLSENATAATTSEVNTKAMRDFRKAFKNVSDEKWYSISSGYLAEFTDHSIKNSVVYDKKGNWVFTIRYYDEKDLPGDVRSQVKKTYYDYTITTVEEIHVDDKVIYLVHLQNDSTWKKVRICDGEMQLIEDFNKQ